MPPGPGRLRWGAVRDRHTLILGSWRVRPGPALMVLAAVPFKMVVMVAVVMVMVMIMVFAIVVFIVCVVERCFISARSHNAMTSALKASCS